MTTYRVAWWNLENLFDEENAPLDRRPEKVARTIAKDIVGWTPELRDRKIEQLSSVIARLHDGQGPDLMGVCEVENRYVLDLLAKSVGARLGRTYEIVHADTDDARGIDVAFLYDPTVLRAPKGGTFFHVVMRRNATREIVQVNFETIATERTWVVFGNHWPSRSGGREESAGYRDIAGETLSYFHQRALEILGADTPAFAMGDFNDEPFDTSLVTHALSTRQRRRVTGSTAVARFWNLMWHPLGGPEGSFYFDNEPNLLDQFLANRNMAGTASPLTVDESSAAIVRFDDTATGDYRAPRPFGGMGKKVDTDGFSDHFPIVVRVTEAG